MYNIYPKKNGYQPPRGYLNKLLLIMKLTTIILITVILHVSASSLAQKVTLAEKNTQLVDVFGHIRTQTGYDFVFAGSDLQGLKPVTINVKNEGLTTVLQKIFAGQPLQFTIEDKLVTIEGKKESLLDKLKAAVAQITITGKVTDETGQPMFGVTVKVKDGNSATSTDNKGSYTITAPDNNSVIVFSFIGFETQEYAAKNIVNGSTIVMKASQTNLREVVVNKGYYTERQELSTGNTSRVTGKEISEQPVSDPILALEGRVPGLYVQQSSGIPGAGSIIRLRGQNSIANGNDPLFIVDGVPYTSSGINSPQLPGGAVGVPSQFLVPGQNAGKGFSPFNNLNPQDIESIEILKDADATAIYGSRGANGVILITTKKGKAGQTLVDANVYTGFGNTTRQMDLLNTQQYLAMRHQAFKNDGQLPGANDYDVNGAWDTTRYTNWQKELIGGTSHFNNAQVSISGGNTNTQFLFGGGYSKQTTVYPGDYNDRKASMHFSLNNVSTNGKFHSTLSAQYVNDNNQIPDVDFTSAALSLAPDAPALYDSKGNLNWQSGTWNNPLATLLLTQQAISTNLIGNLNLSYEVLPGLQVKSNFGYTRMELTQNRMRPATYFYGPPSASRRLHQFGTNYVNTIRIEPQLSYSRNIGQGKLEALIGITDERDHQNSFGITATNFPSDVQIGNIFAASSLSSGGSFDAQYNYSAIYGRLGYNWKEKYLINLTGRRDGSSRFGPGNQFGNFGAIGAGWIFSKEKFISDNFSFLSFGKLRASYGTAGNDQISNYQYLSAYGFNTSNTYQNVNTISPNNIGNPYFGWEVVKKLEAGIELGVLNDRIRLNVDYYRNRTGNQLVGQPLPTTTGFTSIQANLPAVVQNKGLEFQLNTININNKAFSWSTSINLSIPTNKLISFPGLSTNTTYANSLAIGKSIYAVKLLHYTGLNGETGTYTFEDVNHDGTLGSADYQFLSQIAQKYYGGFLNSINFKGWQLDFLIQFVKQTGRNYLVNPNLFPAGYLGNQPTAVLGAWREPGDKTTIEIYTQNGGSQATSAHASYQGSDASISDASFVRLKNVSLSYQLPQKWRNALMLKNARLYFQAQNLITITNYLGLDPETQGQNLPPLRMITTGIQIGF